MNNQLVYVPPNNSMYVFSWDQLSHDAQTLLLRNMLSEKIHDFEQRLLINFQQPVQDLRVMKIDWVRMWSIKYNIFPKDGDGPEDFREDIFSLKNNLYKELTWDSIEARLYFFDTMIAGHLRTLQYFGGGDFNAMVNSPHVRSHNRIFIEISSKLKLLNDDLETFRCFIKWTTRLVKQFKYDLDVFNSYRQHDYSGSVDNILEVLKKILEALEKI